MSQMTGALEAFHRDNPLEPGMSAQAWRAAAHAQRDELCPRPAAASFFVTTRGARLTHASVYLAFHELVVGAGLQHASQGRPPRVHDLRHSFAVRTLLGWYREGADVQALLPLLSTYMGHIRPASTFWYLSASPELMALAAQRLDDATGVTP